jgi:site-specific recombinase XerD
LGPAGNLVAQGKDHKTINTYRVAVDGFVESCSKTYIDEIEKQDLFDYMTWLRRQPATKRKHSNPDRTYNNKLSHTSGEKPSIKFACIRTRTVSLFWI